tara:strand:+ start:193 stop:924 length:732 start_codon:yes stop_codon:yes gene_type:complete
MNTYKNTGYSPEKFNSIISQLNDRISCDSECEKNLHAQKLKQTWASAINNKKNANKNVLNAEKKYYIFAKGQDEYKKLLNIRKQDANRRLQNIFLKEKKNIISKINNNIRRHESTSNSKAKIEQLLVLKQNKLYELEKKINTVRDNAFTNNRKVVYETTNSTNLYHFKYLILLIYYIPIFILVLTIINDNYLHINTPNFINRFIKIQYENIFYKIITILYTIFPYFVSYFVELLIFAFEYSIK